MAARSIRIGGAAIEAQGGQLHPLGLLLILLGFSLLLLFGFLEKRLIPCL